MIDPNFILLYVNSTETSVRFYTDLLGKSPIEASPTFAMFMLSSGMMLGLWSRQTVEPSVAGHGVGGELAFALGSNDEVNEAYASLHQRGLTVAQEPTHMDFGYTFVVLDPDGHRLRVFAPAGH
ncbi:VOC family protein [Undibacterium rugosum]|uniref:VOC family protein n=1 Tax=Undibacterium rugosum TaxID=2762291 RepID=A0A923I949_9BURK|nr:VOC family protein [Undibacterium rugosum]MBC3935833.1 VOC family protein [Undibacterium rugosum]MBR7779385.1 VOC family protein [Undibacterium rugosum]